MNNSEYDRLYGRFTETIQDATKNLDHLDDILNGRVSEVIEQAAEKVSEAIKNQGTGNVKTEQPVKERPKAEPVTPRSVSSHSAGKPKKTVLYDNGNDLMAASIAGVVLGAFGLLIGLFTALFSLVMLVLSSNPTIIAVASGMAFGFLLMIGGTAGLIAGGNTLSFIKRFREYKDILKNKTVIELSDLSKLSGKSIRYLIKDLRKMMQRKLFLQGHFDEEMSNFITSDETYAHYEELVRQMKAEEREEKKQESFSSELRDVLNQGYEYLEKIQVANAELPGEVITAKLNTLETVIRRILEEVKEQPKSVSDLSQLMTYYLPTTWKLISAYREIEKKDPKTAQMIQSQKEIETTLDTVNEAFKKLLDQLFQTKAWDISSDIDVLNSMLTSEGLKDSSFVLKK